MKSIIVTVVLCVLFLKLHTAVAKCPESTNSHRTVNIPHETACDKFYICQNGRKIEVSCPSYLHFNVFTQACDWPEKANCLKKSSLDCTSSVCSEMSRTKRSRCSEDQYLPHETHCHKYYKCVYGKEVLKICPKKMVFNPELGNCDFKYNVQCKFDTEKVSKRDVLYDDFLDDYFVKPSRDDLDYWEDFLNNESTTENTDTTAGYLMNDKFPSECLESSDDYEPTLIPHEKKCNAYYKCLRGKKQVMHCPGMLQFNPKILLCDWPRNVRCVGKKIATTTTVNPSTAITQLNCPRSTCQDSTIYLPSTEDARQFIRCQNGDEVFEYCPNGLVFDVKLRVCNLAHLAETVEILM